MSDELIEKNEDRNMCDCQRDEVREKMMMKSRELDFAIVELEIEKD